MSDPAPLPRVSAAKYPGTAKDPPLPPLSVIVGQAARAAAAEIRTRAAGVAPLEDAEVARRLDICRTCDHWRSSDSRCSKCGCYVRHKTRLRSSSCPIGKW